jgi:hypothetical protein
MGNQIISSVAGVFLKLGHYPPIEHHGVCIETEKDGFFVVQFATINNNNNNKLDKPTICVSRFRNKDNAIHEIKRVAGKPNQKNISQEKYDCQPCHMLNVIRFLEDYDFNYHITINNCQFLSQGIVDRFCNQ